MRIRINFPAPFVFSTNISVRISDINYGGHVGNDSVLSILHEARLRFLKQWNYTELEAGGCGLIMADSAIQYKGEAFYGDDLTVEVLVSNLSTISFDIFYKITTLRKDEVKQIAYAKTGMICYDYNERKIMTMPHMLHHKLQPNLPI